MLENIKEWRGWNIQPFTLTLQSLYYISVHLFLWMINANFCLGESLMKKKITVKIKTKALAVDTCIYI